MDSDRTIAERLEDAAAAATPEIAAELRAAAAKIETFSRAPGKRADADRIATVLTPDVVRALGRAFLDLRSEELADPATAVFGSEFRQADYAFAGLLIAAGNPELCEPAIDALESVVALVEEMEPKQAEHVQYLAGLYPEVSIGADLQSATASRLAKEPETTGARWARELGLGLPVTFWSLSVSVPGALTDGRGDISVYMDVENTPGSESRWSIRIGAINTNSLGGNQPPSVRDSSHGSYDRKGLGAGRIEPAGGPSDLPRVVADLERAHPNLQYDRASISVKGAPGRLISPTKKKLLITWLSVPE